jgi:hypothetical protein
MGKDSSFKHSKMSRKMLIELKMQRRWDNSSRFVADVITRSTSPETAMSSAMDLGPLALLVMVDRKRCSRQ